MIMGFLGVSDDLQAEVPLGASSGRVTVGVGPGFQQILEVFLLEKKVLPSGLVFSVCLGYCVPKKPQVVVLFQQRKVVSWLTFGFILLGVLLVGFSYLLEADLGVQNQI